MDFVNYKQLKSKGIPWGPVHIRRLERQGKFPQGIQLGRCTKAWVEEEIDEYIAKLLTNRSLHTPRDLGGRLNKPVKTGEAA
jgi:hypothetical protein